MRGGALFKGKEGRGDFRKNSTVGRLHPRFLRKRGLGRKWSPPWQRRDEVDRKNSTWTVLEAQNPEASCSFWDYLTPRVVITVVTLLVVLLSVRELQRRKVYWGVDLVLLLIDGLAGLLTSSNCCNPSSACSQLLTV